MQLDTNFKFRAYHRSGCYNKNATDWVNLNHKHLFLSSGGWKVKAPADWVFSENPLPGSLTAVFSLCPHMAEEVVPGVPFLRALIPFTRTPQTMQLDTNFKFRAYHRSGCYNKNATDWVNLNHKHLFLSSGGWKVKAPADWVFSENPLPGSLTAVFSLCPHMAEEVVPGVPFLRALIPFTRTPPLWLHLQMPNLQMPSLWGLGSQLMDWEGIKTFSL